MDDKAKVQLNEAFRKMEFLLNGGRKRTQSDNKAIYKRLIEEIKIHDREHCNMFRECGLVETFMKRLFDKHSGNKEEVKAELRESWWIKYYKLTDQANSFYVKYSKS